jgi:hypothetical protein
MSKPATSAKDWSDVVKGAKRELLLRAARDEFAEQGLEGATMRGIALRAGCTTGAIYPALDAYVAEAVSAARTPEAKVEAGCAAFLNYYLDHRFEINLGLYAFRGLKRLGVGKPSNDELNQALWNVLERIAVPLTEVRGLKPAEVRPWVALLTSQMIGALVLQIAGRLDFLDTGAQTLLRMMLAQCLPQTAPKGRKALRKSKQ